MCPQPHDRWTFQHVDNEVVAVPAKTFWETYRFRWVKGNQVAEIDVAVSSPEVWEQRQESTSGLWTTARPGGFVIAVRQPAVRY